MGLLVFVLTILCIMTGAIKPRLSSKSLDPSPPTWLDYLELTFIVFGIWPFLLLALVMCVLEDKGII